MGGHLRFHSGGQEVRGWQAIDHSDIYLENKRLAQDLVIYLEKLRYTQYQQLMSLDSAIAKIRQDIDATTSVKSSSGQSRQFSQRPLSSICWLSLSSSPVLSTRSRLVGQRAILQTPHKSNKADTISAVNESKSVMATRNASTDNSDFKGNSRKGNPSITGKLFASPNMSQKSRSPENKLTKSPVVEENDSNAEESSERKTSRAKVASAKAGKQSTSKTVTEGRETPNIKVTNPTSATRGNNEDSVDDSLDGETVTSSRKSKRTPQTPASSMTSFPSEWYRKVVPASDVSIRHRTIPAYNSRGEKRNRRLPGQNPFQGQDKSAGRTRPGGPGQLRPAGLTSKSSPPPPPPPTSSTVICHEPPTSRTHRQLVEMCSGEDTMQSKSYLILQQRRQTSREQMKQTEDKVKDFLRSLDELNKTRKNNKKLYVPYEL